MTAWILVFYLASANTPAFLDYIPTRQECERVRRLLIDHYGENVARAHCFQTSRSKR